MQEQEIAEKILNTRIKRKIHGINRSDFWTILINARKFYREGEIEEGDKSIKEAKPRVSFFGYDKSSLMKLAEILKETKEAS